MAMHIRSFDQISPHIRLYLISPAIVQSLSIKKIPLIARKCNLVFSMSSIMLFSRNSEQTEITGRFISDEKIICVLAH